MHRNLCEEKALLPLLVTMLNASWRWVLTKPTGYPVRKGSLGTQDTTGATYPEEGRLKDTEKPTSYKMRRKARGKWDLPTAWLSICTWDGINLCYLMCVCEDFCTIFRTKSQNQNCKMNNADIFKLSFVFIRRHKFP